MNSSGGAIVVEQSFDESIQSVWDSITKLDRMHQWFFENIPEFEPVVGFHTEFEVFSVGVLQESFPDPVRFHTG